MVLPGSHKDLPTQAKARHAYFGRGVESRGVGRGCGPGRGGHSHRLEKAGLRGHSPGGYTLGGVFRGHPDSCAGGTGGPAPGAERPHGAPPGLAGLPRHSHRPVPAGPALSVRGA